MSSDLDLLEPSQMNGVLVLDYLMRQSLTSFATRAVIFLKVSLAHAALLKLPSGKFKSRR